MSRIVIDAELFHPDAIAPETAKWINDIEELLKDAPTIMEVGPEKVRALRREGIGLLGHQPLHSDACWITAEALGRNVPVRMFTPNTAPIGALIHIHGGGMVLGAADAQDQRLMALAQRMNVNIASIEYRLAPEHSFPAGPDDCEAAALWLCQNAKSALHTDRLIITGESAGGYLSALTLLRLKQKHDLMPFAGANLIYGQFDSSLTPSVHGWGERNLILNTEIVEWFGEQYLPSATYPPARRRAPDISPMYNDLEGLCPALFTCGTLDPLIDDNILMAQRWAAAGNEAELDIYPGGVHVFDMLPDLPLADEANAKMEAWMTRQLTS